MADTGITMRVIPTTVSVGAIGISDTTGINRQNRKNSYIPHNRQSLPTARIITEESSSTPLRLGKSEPDEDRLQT